MGCSGGVPHWAFLFFIGGSLYFYFCPDFQHFIKFVLFSSPSALCAICLILHQLRQLDRPVWEERWVWRSHKAGGGSAIGRYRSGPDCVWISQDFSFIPTVTAVSPLRGVSCLSHRVCDGVCVCVSVFQSGHSDLVSSLHPLTCCQSSHHLHLQPAVFTPWGRGGGGGFAARGSRGSPRSEASDWRQRKPVSTQSCANAIFSLLSTLSWL